MRDLYNNLTIRPVIAPAANANLATTPLVGAVIDHRGYDSALYAINLGALTDADAVYAVLLEESNIVDSDFTAVADADMHGTEAAAGFTFDDDGEVRKLGYKGFKRYTRLTITPTTTANSGNSPIGAIIILGSPSIAPVA